MQAQWIDLLSGLREAADKLSADVPAQLAWSGWQVDDVERLWFVLEQLCIQSEAVVELIRSTAADDTLIEAAKELQEVFLALLATVGEKAYALGSEIRRHSILN